MELNKIELKKISHDFNILSSRIMRAKFDDYNLVLRKFLAFIDRNDVGVKTISNFAHISIVP